VAKRGDRFASLEPIYDAVTDRPGRVDNNLARGISMRHDWGPQYTSSNLQGAIRGLGIEDSPAFAGEPPVQRLRGTLHQNPQGAVPP
jgi:putative transposase